MTMMKSRREEMREAALKVVDTYAMLWTELENRGDLDGVEIALEGWMGAHRWLYEIENQLRDARNSDGSFIDPKHEKAFREKIGTPSIRVATDIPENGLA